MEPERFDRLTRSLTSARSRRGVLAVLGSGALTTGLGLARPQPAEAHCRRAHNCSNGSTRFCKDASSCLKVKDVDTGRCTCIVAGACGGPCTTSAQCGSGRCVFAKGCCHPETEKWCATLCI